MSTLYLQNMSAEKLEKYQYIMVKNKALSSGMV